MIQGYASLGRAGQLPTVYKPHHELIAASWAQVTQEKQRLRHLRDGIRDEFDIVEKRIGMPIDVARRALSQTPLTSTRTHT